jgi:hypothetical protein
MKVVLLNKPLGFGRWIVISGKVREIREHLKEIRG